MSALAAVVYLSVLVTTSTSATSVSSSSSSTLTFLVMGDWGGSEHAPYTTSAEVETAKGMEATAKALSPQPQFSLALGDNFYSVSFSC